LRPLTHGEVGTLRLPPTVSFGAAANPADVATAGWELSAPTANRFCHLDWSMPLEVFAECIVTGGWPGIPLFHVPSSYEGGLAAARGQVAGFLRARRGQLSSVPSDAAARGRAFPTPRTWDYACRLMALARCSAVTPRATRLLVFGTVGEATGHEFLAWLDALDLPDPEVLLASPQAGQFTGMRPDRVYAALQSLLAAVIAELTAERWTAAIRVCGAAATVCGVDAAVPVVRALLREGVRPDGADLPGEIKVFAAPLALAGLLREPAA
jgi:hypothetical protein